MLPSGAVDEHPHRCLYCEALWFCQQECPLVGPSVCDTCRDRIRRTPETPLRVIPLRDPSVLARLAENEGKRWRQSFRRRLG